MDLTCVGHYDADTILSEATNGAVIILAYTDPNSGKTFFYCTVSSHMYTVTAKTSLVG